MFQCSGIFRVPLRVVSKGCGLNTVFIAGCHQAVARYEMPVVCLVGARLACDNNVFAMIFDSLAAETACRMSAVRIVGIFPIQSSAGVC